MKEEKENVAAKIIFKWWHYAGGIGTLLAVLGLIWGVYQWEDEKKHDRKLMEEQKSAWNEAAEKGKSDVTINLDLPDVDVDGTLKAAGELKDDLAKKASETGAAGWGYAKGLVNKAKEGYKKWTKADCDDPAEIPSELYEELCGMKEKD